MRLTSGAAESVNSTDSPETRKLEQPMKAIRRFQFPLMRRIMHPVSPSIDNRGRKSTADRREALSLVVVSAQGREARRSSFLAS